MLLTMKEQKRVEVMQGVMDERLALGQAARVLDRSIRQVYRLLARIREKGLSGMIHGNKGRSSPRRLKTTLQQRILKLVRGRYKDINDTHLQEILSEREGIQVSRETLRGLLRQAGIGPKRPRRRPKYRARRERKEAFGVMLQIDGSRHDWLEGRGPWLTLVGAIDDATGHVWAQFHPAETTWAYFDLMELIFAKNGLPLSLYSDKHSIFQIYREPTLLEQLADTASLTQFGRAMNEVGITLIRAHSPQAKGRVERLWETFQDRLVVELRLAGVRTREEANQVLQRYLPIHNRRFAVLPAQQQPVFRKTPSTETLQRILCIKDTRTVNRDHTISFEGLILQIPRSKLFRSLVKRRVEVLQLRHGGIEITYQNKTVATFSPDTIRELLLKRKLRSSELKIAA